MKILRLPEVIARTGLSRPTVYRYVARRLFPAPVPLGRRAVGWLESEINEWMMQRAAARSQQNTDRSAA